MHEYYLVLHVHIHITSKNGDACKLGEGGHIAPPETVFAQLLKGDAGAYSKSLSGGRNNCTMREDCVSALKEKCLLARNGW